ncbi:MAG: LysR family transcriptional regulator [Labilithrix sp.]|nr:LysR family transcriptional regulator [Labilithrix sp.]
MSIPIPKPALDVRDLAVIMALAREGSTARAAPQLHLTQSAVSRALAAAEHKLGVRLFERTVRGLAPTRACETLVDGSRAVLAELVDLERRARSPAPKKTKLRVVCQCYTAYHWLPTALSTLARIGLSVSIAVEHTRDPVAAVAAGEIDVALLTTGSPPKNAGMDAKPLLSDELVFLVAREHALASARSITPGDLIDHGLLSNTVPAAQGAWFLRRVFGRKRVRLRYREMPLTEAVVELTRAGEGVAVMSEWVAMPYLERGDVLGKRLASGPLLRPWTIAYRREHVDAATRLRDVLATTAPRGRP